MWWRCCVRRFWWWAVLGQHFLCHIPGDSGKGSYGHPSLQHQPKVLVFCYWKWWNFLISLLQNWYPLVLTVKELIICCNVDITPWATFCGGAEIVVMLGANMSSWYILQTWYGHDAFTSYYCDHVSCTWIWVMRCHFIFFTKLQPRCVASNGSVNM